MCLLSHFADESQSGTAVVSAGISEATTTSSFASLPKLTGLSAGQAPTSDFPEESGERIQSMEFNLHDLPFASLVLFLKKLYKANTRVGLRSSVVAHL